MKVAVVTAVRPETRAALRGLSDVVRARDGGRIVWCGRAGATSVRVVEAGVGPRRAEAAVARLDAPPDVLLSLGFAGGLRAGIVPGTIVVCDRLLWDGARGPCAYEVPARLVSALREAATGPTVDGALLSSPLILGSAAAKAAAGASSGAVAVEMEGAALAGYARRQHVPLLPVRAVLDPMELSLEDLPDGIGSSWLVRTRLLASPGLWPTLRLLRLHASSAAKVLEEVSARLLRALTGRD